MKKLYGFIFLIACCVLFPGPSFAQVKFQMAFGGNMDEEFNSVMQTTDGGYIMAGQTTSYGAGAYDICLVKTDGNGNMLWRKIFGGTANDLGYGVRQTPDGGYIVYGWSHSFTGNYDNIILIKTDSSGTFQWAKQPVIPNSVSVSNGLEVTADGGFIVTGFIALVTLTDVYMLKLDSAANVQWAKSFGTTMQPEEGRDVKQTLDGGYIIMGGTRSYGAGGGDVYLVKTDAAGAVQWSKTYGTTGSEAMNTGFIIQTPDSGYVISTTSPYLGAGYYEGYVVRTDKAGNMMWSKTYGGSQNDYQGNIKMTADGGFVIPGRTHSFGLGYGDAFIMKIDTAGSLAWTKRYVYSLFGMDHLSYVTTTSDGGLVVAGFHDSSFGHEGYLIKTDSAGNSGCNENTYNPYVNIPATIVTSPVSGDTVLTPVVNTITTLSVTSAGSMGPHCFSTGINEVDIEALEFEAYPNPFKESLTLALSVETGITNCRAALYDVFGRVVLVQQLSRSNTMLQTLNLRNGIYFLEVTEGINRVVRKIVKQ